MTSDKFPQAEGNRDDGTICLGISPNTRKPFYVAAADELLRMAWNDAMKAASESTVMGLSGWRLPTRAELNVIHENKSKGALKGTFNETGSIFAGRYWSSTENDFDEANAQRFSDGHRDWHGKYDRLSVRLVRD